MEKGDDIMRAAIKKTTFLFMIMIIFVVGLCVTAVVTFADSYHTIRINYVFKDGTPAHDPYVAAYRVNSAVDIEVTNPKIDGYVPMTALEDGLSAEKTKFKYDAIDENKDVTVYYLAGLTHYKAIYYKQNIYDDLYTRDNTIEDQYVNRWGYTGSNPTELEELQFSGFTNLFHEPDAIAADGSTEFRVYYDRNYYTVNFDLGEGGYGVEPVYAKYQTTYHIGEPKRLGFEFKGWVRTNLFPRTICIIRLCGLPLPRNTVSYIGWKTPPVQLRSSKWRHRPPLPIFVNWLRRIILLPRQK